MKVMVQHWKTTAAGVLSAFIGMLGPLSAFLGAYQAIEATIPGHAAADYRLAIWGAGLTCAGAVARAWIGLISNDAPPNDSVALKPAEAPKP